MAIQAVGKATAKPIIHPVTNLCRKRELNPVVNRVIVKVITVSSVRAIKSTVKRVILVEGFKAYRILILQIK
jgi:hypothetical protein